MIAIATTAKKARMTSFRGRELFDGSQPVLDWVLFGDPRGTMLAANRAAARRLEGPVHSDPMGAFAPELHEPYAGWFISM